MLIFSMKLKQGFYAPSCLRGCHPVVNRSAMNSYCPDFPDLPWGSLNQDTRHIAHRWTAPLLRIARGADDSDYTWSNSNGPGSVQPAPEDPHPPAVLRPVRRGGGPHHDSAAGPGQDAREPRACVSGTRAELRGKPDARVSAGPTREGFGQLAIRLGLT